MNILSLHTSHHDANFCVLKEGSVIQHNEIERFTRIKHDGCLFNGFSERLNQTLESSKIFDEELNYGTKIEIICQKSNGIGYVPYDNNIKEHFGGIGIWKP